jgi:hypothetical protein
VPDGSPLHTREVAGSKPAAPIYEEPAKTTNRSQGAARAAPFVAGQACSSVSGPPTPFPHPQACLEAWRIGAAAVDLPQRSPCSPALSNTRGRPPASPATRKSRPRTDTPNRPPVAHADEQRGALPMHHLFRPIPMGTRARSVERWAALNQIPASSTDLLYCIPSRRHRPRSRPPTRVEADV